MAFIYALTVKKKQAFPQKPAFFLIPIRVGNKSEEEMFI